MTASTTTHSQSGKKTHRPSTWRVVAAKYVDLLICGFMAWILAFTFGWQSSWATLTLFLFFCEWFWCRDRLNPTAGEYCLGIRYLTSASSQVVADIQVVNNKVKLNGFLILLGVAELTTAILFLCGWTFMSKVAVWNNPFGPPLSLLYWVASGFAFFICAGYLLSGSKNAFWAIPVIHGVFALDFFQSRPLWEDLLKTCVFANPWAMGAMIHLAQSQFSLLLEGFAVWSFFAAGVLIFSRKHLINP